MGTWADCALTKVFFPNSSKSYIPEVIDTLVDVLDKTNKIINIVLAI